MAKSQNTRVDFDPESNAHVGTFSEEIAASTAVVDVLSSIKGCPKLDIGPLAHSVDTDALNELVASAGAESLEISFDVEEFTARVRGDGTVVVTSK